MLQRMMRAFVRSVPAALGLAVALCACAPGAIIEKLPGDMGEPAGTPARPTTPYAYPAVHDIPASHQDAALTEEQQVKLENELKAARDHLEAQEKAAAVTEEQRVARENELRTVRDQQEATATAKAKKPAAAKKSQTTGVQDGAKTNP